MFLFSYSLSYSKLILNYFASFASNTGNCDVLSFSRFSVSLLKLIFGYKFN